MKNKIFILCTFLYLSLTLMANGGVVRTSSVNKSSSPSFLNIKDVSIISENLDIKLVNEYSYVVVTYVLWNNSGKEYLDANYGFPVDYSSKKDEYSTKYETWSDSYVTEVNFIQDGKYLEYTNGDGVDMPSVDEEGLYRKWFYTKINISKYAMTTLVVKYKLKNEGYVGGADPLFIEAINGHRHCSFSYDFSPAKHWNDGIVRDFFVKIDASELTGFDLRERDVDKLKIGELELQEEGNIFTGNARNFDLNTSEKIQIAYGCIAPNYIDGTDLLRAYRIPDHFYTMTTSSQRDSYPNSNLMDMNLETAWAVKGGEGEWVEFRIGEEITSIAGILLVNGYHKNEKTYTENGRIKKLSIIPILENELSEEEKEERVSRERTFNLKDEPYQKLYFKDLIEKVFVHDFFDDSHFFDSKLKGIRIKILDTYPGTKYDDLCVSEILLLKSYY